MAQTKIISSDIDIPRKIQRYEMTYGATITTTATAYTDTGISTTYTAGPVDETLRVTVNILMRNTGTGAVYMTLNVDGVDLGDRIYNNVVNTWLQLTRNYVVDVAANATVTVKLRWFVTSGATGSITRGNQYHTPHLIMKGIPRV